MIGAMFCKKCGADIGDAKYCYNCGEEVISSGEKTYYAAENETPSYYSETKSASYYETYEDDTRGQNTKTSVPYYTENSPNVTYDSGIEKKVSKVAYVLLVFFLGGFGIHRFYAGRNVSGILYLLAFISGIGTIITGPLALIEFIVALFRKSDCDGKLYVYRGKYFV